MLVVLLVCLSSGLLVFGSYSLSRLRVFWSSGLLVFLVYCFSGLLVFWSSGLSGLLVFWSSGLLVAQVLEALRVDSSHLNCVRS